MKTIVAEITQAIKKLKYQDIVEILGDEKKDFGIKLHNMLIAAVFY